jgi:O-antigen/teichoic acid export membrane protein
MNRMKSYTELRRQSRRRLIRKAPIPLVAECGLIGYWNCNGAMKEAAGKHRDVEKGLLSDGVYVVLGQCASAIGTLVGVRLLTEVLDLEVFGSVALVTGLVALAQGISSGGLMQAILRMYPACSRNKTLDLLRAASSRILSKTTLWLAGVLAIGCLVYSFATRGNPWSFVLVPGLLIVETVRFYHVTFLNAAHRQRLMASWMGSESWVRTICALAAIFLVGANTEAVLGGFLVGTGVLWICFSRAVSAASSENQAGELPSGPSVRRSEELQSIQAEFIRYARPLFPLGVVGWISGQADRYIIGGLLGLTSAGQYAAIYGLVSKPFLMAGASVELVFRQFFYESVSSGDLSRARRVLVQWLSIVGVVSVLGVVGFSVFHSNIAGVLLAEPYRGGAHLMPWIAVGYCLLLFAQVVERVCYATKDTRSVLFIQTVGAISSVPISAFGVAWSGLPGAARAVPAYFGLQLSIALLFAYRSARGHLHRVKTMVPK